jgi:hypothetical protein
MQGRILKILGIIFIIANTVSCSLFKDSQFLSSTIYLTTYPDQAKVYVYSLNDEKYHQVGRSPYQLASLKELGNVADLSRPVMIMVEKEGYVPEHVVLDDIKSAKFSINVKLKPLDFWSDPNNENSSILVHSVGKKIQNIYRYIRAAKYDDALIDVDLLLKTFPSAAIFHDIKGSIYVLKGMKSEAIAEYERSLQIRKDNPEAEKTLIYLKGN